MADGGQASRAEALAAAKGTSPCDAEHGVAEESEDSEADVVLGNRPFGLDVCPAAPGSDHGALACVVEPGGSASNAGVEVGSAILRINEESVEDLLTVDIRKILEEEDVPLTLGLRLPAALGTKRRSRLKDPVTVCTSYCRGSFRAVSEAVERLGWRELPTLSRDASVLWLEHSDSTDGIAPVQVVSRIEAFLYYCQKVRLALCLNVWVQELPDDFAFSPRTWILPDDTADLESFVSNSKGKTFIVKPTAGSQGKGIFLARKWKDLESVAAKTKVSSEITGRPRTTCEYVVQEYYANPFLLDGLKFDLRLYVVVTSIVPLRAYLFREGLARFCTTPYQPPKEANLSEVCMHLTNYAVNKTSLDFEASESLAQHGEGSKRSVSSVLQQIERLHGVSPDTFWHKIGRLAANTLMALRPHLVEFYVHEKPRCLHPVGPKGFQIIGLDVLIDDGLEPRLLELNANPSLSVGLGGAKEDQSLLTEPGISDAAASSNFSPPQQPIKPKRRSWRRTHTEPRESTPVAELDLAVKRELICQAMSVAKPAPGRKAERLKRRWQKLNRHGRGSEIPLDDSGEWTLSSRQAKVETIRPDAPNQCPALDELDFDALAADQVSEYASAHLMLYRHWYRACGASQDTLGQAPALKILERAGLLGPNGSFPDRLAAQLWLSREWRGLTNGEFGLTFPQFIVFAGKIGCRRLGEDGGNEDDGPSHVDGLLAFEGAMNRGGGE